MSTLQPDKSEPSKFQERVSFGTWEGLSTIADLDMKNFPPENVVATRGVLVAKGPKLGLQPGQEAILVFGPEIPATKSRPLVVFDTKTNQKLEGDPREAESGYYLHRSLEKPETFSEPLRPGLVLEISRAPKPEDKGALQEMRYCKIAVSEIRVQV